AGRRARSALCDGRDLRDGAGIVLAALWRRLLRGVCHWTRIARRRDRARLATSHGAPYRAVDSDRRAVDLARVPVIDRRVRRRREPGRQTRDIVRATVETIALGVRRSTLACFHGRF